MGGDGRPPFSACDFQPARQSVGDAVCAAPLSHGLLGRPAALTDRAHVVVSRLAVAPLLALVLAGWGEAEMAEVEASFRCVAGGFHQTRPLRAVRAGLAGPVLLADGGVGRLVHQDGVQSGRGHGIGS